MSIQVILARNGLFSKKISQPTNTEARSSVGLLVAFLAAKKESERIMTQASMSLFEPLREGWDWMVRMLFRPFNLGKWMVVGFAAWLAGLAGGGGNSGTHWSSDEGRVEVAETAQQGWAWLTSHGVVAGLIIVGLVVVLALIIFVLWVSSRGKFIFLDNVMHDRAAIVEPWQRLQKLGDSLFAFRLIVVLLFFPLALAFVGLSIWLAAGSGGWAHQGGAAVVIGLVVSACVGAVLTITTLYAVFFLDAFVVPLMYRFDLGVMDAWRRFLGLLQSRPGWFLLSGLFVFALWILAFAIIVVTGLMTCCLGFLLLAIPYLGTVLLLPLIVTYRAFTVSFLAQVEPELRLGTLG